jgi:hypothetical protein
MRAQRRSLVALLAAACGSAAPDSSLSHQALTTPDVPGARALLQNLVIPNLQASFAWRLREGDNAARMSVVRRGIDLALDLLALRFPMTRRAAAVLRSPVIPVLESSPGYRRTLAANPNVFAATRIAIARRGLAQAAARLVRVAFAPTDAPAAPPDAAGARGLLRGTAIPNLEASTAYRMDEGDNLARMSLVHIALEIAADLLALTPPEARGAAGLLRSLVVPVLESAPGYRIVLSRNPNAFWHTRLGVARRAIADALARLLPPAPPTVWERAGLFIANASAFSSHLRAPQLQTGGFAWLAVKIHDGSRLEPANEHELAGGWARRFREAGIVVGAWGVNRAEPEIEAALAADLVQRWGFAFYIADAEIEYKYTQGDGSFSPEAYGRSRRFVAAFRARLPSLPAALSSYGRTDLADIDWTAWREAGFDWLPQAYWNDYEIYEPLACVLAAERSGWPRTRVHPTVGIWGGGIRGYVSLESYAARLREARTVGWSLYLGEQMPEEEWGAIARGVAAGLAR